MALGRESHLHWKRPLNIIKAGGAIANTIVAGGGQFGEALTTEAGKAGGAIANTVVAGGGQFGEALTTEAGKAGGAIANTVVAGGGQFGEALATKGGQFGGGVATGAGKAWAAAERVGGAVGARWPPQCSKILHLPCGTKLSQSAANGAEVSAQLLLSSPGNLHVGAFEPADPDTEEGEDSAEHEEYLKLTTIGGHLPADVQQASQRLVRRSLAMRSSNGSDTLASAPLAEAGPFCGRWLPEMEAGRDAYIQALKLPWVLQKVAKMVRVPPMENFIHDGLLVSHVGPVLGMIFPFVYADGGVEEKVVRGVKTTTTYKWLPAGALAVEGIAHIGGVQTSMTVSSATTGTIHQRMYVFCGDDGHLREQQEFRYQEQGKDEPTLMSIVYLAAAGGSAKS
eukprot:CAMPEP_0119402792 /NCGR_PEP_ID=MMETSP1334-20130426/143059_1 /TAXON_ID=127549 /ORGANISM="Calcidiscus leptoporus, Strain RCC1130" /LENGTH=395 /DNA_ID=CAMNT_0007426729 /DNA_START=181 /DNA_END=1368 /DNA_ORIENTATION=+